MKKIEEQDKIINKIEKELNDLKSQNRQMTKREMMIGVVV